jgi:hypothetical protein
MLRPAPVTTATRPTSSCVSLMAHPKREVARRLWILSFVDYSFLWEYSDTKRLHHNNPF